MPAVRRTSVLALIPARYLMIGLDIAIVITALPKIHQGLAFSATALSWVQNAYTLAFGELLLLGAHVGDILGRREARYRRISSTGRMRRVRRSPAAPLSYGCLLLTHVACSYIRACPVL